jgi:hypothetical protein
VGIYPNPSNGMINITNEKEIQKVVLYNSMGQAILSYNANSNFLKMNIDDLPSGIYTVKTTINGVDTFNKMVRE